MRQIITHHVQLRQILVNRRKALKISQRVLASQLALSQSRLSEIEAEIGSLTVDRLLELSNILGLELIIQERPLPQSRKKSEW